MILKGQDNTWQPAKDPGSISAKIEASNRNIQSLQCDFEQEKELSFLEEKVFSSGKFHFERENKIRWEYVTPYSYIIIMNGSLIRIVDEGRSNTLDASSNRLFSSINEVMAGIIDGSVIQRSDRFRASFFENQQGVMVSLDPMMSGMKEFIDRIELEMNKEDHTVDALRIIEKNGDYTLIAFKNKKINAPVAQELFDVN